MMVTGVVGLGTLGDSLVAAIDSPGFAPSAIAVAIGAGAVHALAPGHGKALTASYLVAADARRREAVLLGATVALMHTGSVVAVALAWMWLSTSTLVDLGPVSGSLRIIAAVMVVLAGALLIRRQRVPRGHSHPHHGRTHQTGHDHTHTAAMAGRPGLVLIAASGGLMPSPAALLVLVTGLFSGRSGLALVLVVSFGFGLAAVLGGLGVAAVAGRDVVLRLVPAGLPDRIAQLVPHVVAWGILAAGCALTAAAVATA